VTTPIAVPALPARQRVEAALRERPDTDYVFDFWTALGWTVLTLGLYSVYVFYQLIRRSRDHNRRRADLLEAAYEAAWQEATARGRAEEMRPAFERVAAEVYPLRRMTQDFRDPALWTLLDIVGGGLVAVVGLVLLDQDLVRHERHERAAAAGMSTILADLGVAMPHPAAAMKSPHNYAGRVVATVFSLGLYGLWWVADVMREGNDNFAADLAWEDALGSAIRSFDGVAVAGGVGTA
jgi:hypothetical protein